MALFAIADTHLSLGGAKPMDIFPGWDGYVERLRRNWLAHVGADDTVVIAGDVSWGMCLEEALEDFRFLDGLPGRKLLLKGNHDYWWTTRRKMEDFFTRQGLSTLGLVHNSAERVGGAAVCGTRGWFFDAGPDADKKVVLREAGRLRASIAAAKQTGGEPVVFLHYPPLSDTMICTELYQVLVEEGVRRCYYGHLHGPATLRACRSERDGIRFSLVSADFLRFCPKRIDAL